MTYSVLGNDTQTNERVELPKLSRLLGLYIIGIQGTGKSGLLENLIIQDINQDIGVCLLDPHGDLTHAVLTRLPDRRVQDVIYLDITDYHYPFGLNLFTCSDLTDPFEVQKTVDLVMHVFEKLLGVSAETPLILEYLLNCTQTLIANPGYTMADIPLLLLNDQCRRKLVTNVTDSDVLLFWQQYALMKPSEQSERSAYILRRVKDFLQSLTRPIVGQSNTTLDLQDMMNTGKILLVKLSPQLDQVTALIGSLLVALLLNAAYNRPAQRRQFHLYADEFQRFATEDFAELLEQARKFGVATTIAHQNRAQLESSDKRVEAKLKARSRSVGNLVVFKINSDDADELAGEFDLTPQPAWEEEIEKEWHERVEEEIIDGVEEIRTPVVDVLNHLLTKGEYPDKRVTAFVRDLHERIGYVKDMDDIFPDAVPLIAKAITKSLNTLLTRANSGTAPAALLQTEREKHNFPFNFISYTLGEWYRRTQISGFDDYRFNYDDYSFYTANYFFANGGARGHPLLPPDGWNELLVRMFTTGGTSAFAEAARRLADLSIPLLLDRNMVHLYPPNEALMQQRMKKYAEQKQIVEDFLTNFHWVLATLAKDPILAGSGKFQPRTRTQITYLTHPRKTIAHPQRTYQDRLNEVASGLVNLPTSRLEKFAQVKIVTDNGIKEHLIKTLDPKQQPDRPLFGQALQARLDHIKAQNIQDGYLRERREVEAEIRQRQARCSQMPQLTRPEPPHPPEEEPPAISRREPL